MKSLLLLFSILLSGICAFSQNVYRFNGNGSWKLVANWLNNSRPPATLANGDSIIIDPNGECVLDTVQSIADGAKLVVSPGKNFRILGNMIQYLDGDFTDSRDGHVYPFKKIGTQIWMTRNMNYADPASWCYNDNSANCDVYGRLYNWNTALTVAPPGWHIPSDSEWNVLIDFLLGPSIAGGAMKSTILWSLPNGGATNNSGFTGLPGGHRYGDGTFGGIGFNGFWWSRTENSAVFAWLFTLNYYYADANRVFDDKLYGLSVRCVKD